MPQVLERLWVPVERTPDQLAEIARNYTEWTEPPSGYPALRAGGEGERLFLTPEEIEERTSYVRIDGEQVRILNLPGGHDAVDSAEREATLANPNVRDNLLHEPDPEFLTGDSSQTFLGGDMSRVRRWLAQGCRDFTTQWRPLIPGIDQLLSLRTEGVEGDPLGMPTGMGSYTSHGLARMGDGVVLHELPNGEIKILLVGRPDDGVWATVGGFGNRLDLDEQGRYSPELCVLRRCRQELGIATDGLKTFAIKRDYPVSGRTTASAGLVTDPRGVLVGRDVYDAFPQIQRRQQVGNMAGWVSVHELLEQNGDARDGRIRPGSELPVWTTHMRYIADGLDAHVAGAS